jgi:hypothetical protein
MVGHTESMDKSVITYIVWKLSREGTTWEIKALTKDSIKGILEK